MPNVVITGANRGIGLALARRYAAAGWQVHAGVRRPEAAEALRALPGVSLHPLEVADQASIEAFAAALAGLPVDHLVNNAGVLGARHTDFGHTRLDDWLAVLRVNSAAPFVLTERLAPNLAAGEGRRVGVISSSLGSIARAENDWPAPYAVSKAAVNMVVRQLSLYLAERGIAVLALDPGWVRTDMGGGEADHAVEDSAAGLFERMTTAGLDMSGGFYRFDGTALPW